MADPVVVVGGGVAGAACARQLVEAGLPVKVIDRGRRVGGRMASRRLNGRPVDLGASYLTVSGAAFAEVVEDWERRGLARPWTDSFTALSSGPPEDKPGPVRWGAPGGLRSLVEDHLAGVAVEHREVERIERVAGRWSVDGTTARAVVLAMPDPQARRLLGEGVAEVAARLDRPWEPILAVAARWGSRTWDDRTPSGAFQGAFVNDHDQLSFVADDGRRRGDDAPVLVAHSTPGFASDHLGDLPAAEAALVTALREALGLGEPVETHLHRWTYARPTGGREEPYLLDPSGLGVCGDGWGASPKVETAWASGAQLGRRLVEALSA